MKLIELEGRPINLSVKLLTGSLSDQFGARLAHYCLFGRDNTICVDLIQALRAELGKPHET